jgi:hypothetical protein
MADLLPNEGIHGAREEKSGKETCGGVEANTLSLELEARLSFAAN